MNKILIVIFLVSMIISCTEQDQKKKIVKSPDAPAAIGPYSQAVRFGNTLYVSGQLGLDPVKGGLVEGGIVPQARQALMNIRSVLTEADYKITDIVQCQVYLTDINNYSEFNKVYTEFFTKDFPARAVIEVAALPANGLVEIMVVARK